MGAKSYRTAAVTLAILLSATSATRADETDDLARVFALEDGRAASHELFAYAAPYRSEAVRVRALTAMGRIGDPAAADALLPAALDENEAIALAAITALGRLWYPNIREPVGEKPDDRALDLLESMLSDTYAFPNTKAAERLRAKAAWSFARIADADRAVALVTLLNRALVAGADAALADQAKAAVAGLYRAKPRGAREAIEKATAHVDPSVRLHAAVGLGRLGDKAARTTLEGLLHDGDRDVRIEAARAIGKLGGPSSPTLPAHMLFSTDSAEVIGGLSSYGQGPIGVPIDRASALLVTATETEAATPVHIAVLDALGRRADLAAVGLLSAQIKRGGVFRARTFRALGQAQAAEVLLGVSAESLAGDYLAATEWVDALAACNMKPATQRLSEILAQPARPAIFRLDRRGKLALVRAASQARATELENRLREYLHDDDEWVRAVACDHVAAHPNIADLEGVLDALSASTEARSADAAVAALGALAAVGKQIEGAAFAKRRVEDAIEPFLSDKRRAVRLKAVEAHFALTGRVVAGASIGAETPLKEKDYRAIARDLGAKPRVVVRTNRGAFTLELDNAVAPVTSHRFAALVRKGFYKDQVVHRVEPNFVVQSGDPMGSGWGGTGRAIRDENGGRFFAPYTLGLATAGPDSGESQWFVTHTWLPHLDDRYTAFGSVVDGKGVVDKLTPGDRIESMSMEGEGDFEPVEDGGVSEANGNRE